jgi:hypothetical protein
MSEDRIKARWLKHVIRGEGKPRSDASERYSYRGVVLYSSSWPVARLVRGPRGWVCVTKSVSPYEPKEWKNDKLGRLHAVLHVEDIGVFSRFEGDMTSDDELHTRINWLSHAHAQLLIEQAQTWPADKVVKAIGWRTLTGGKILMDDHGILARGYAQYAETFELNWAKWPVHYYDDLKRAITAREKDYFHPKAEEQRVRQRARKEAKEALGIE